MTDSQPPKPGGDRRRTIDTTGANAGRRWVDDPELAAAFERVLVRLSQLLYMLRSRCGWSQEQLAERAGVDAATILRLEKATTDPQLSTLVRIARAFGRELEIWFRWRQR